MPLTMAWKKGSAYVTARATLPQNRVETRDRDSDCQAEFQIKINKSIFLSDNNVL